MKAYKEKIPVMIIGGHTGSFLGEYQAGGIIIVLGINTVGKPIVGTSHVRNARWKNVFARELQR